MEAILKFNLNDPEDVKAHFRAVKSLDMASVIFQITHNLRRQLEDRVNEQALVIVFETIQGILEDNAICVNELID